MSSQEWVTQSCSSPTPPGDSSIPSTFSTTLLHPSLMCSSGFGFLFGPCCLLYEKTGFQVHWWSTTSMKQVSHLNRRNSNESFKETRPIMHLGKHMHPGEISMNLVQFGKRLQKSDCYASNKERGGNAYGCLVFALVLLAAFFPTWWSSPSPWWTCLR